MTCGDRETLTRYCSATLPAGELEAVRGHLEECPTCEATVAALRAASAPPDGPSEAPAWTSPAPLAGLMDDAGGCPTREELQAHLDGTLPMERRAEVRDHVSECDACFETVRELREGLVVGDPNGRPPEPEWAEPVARSGAFPFARIGGGDEAPAAPPPSLPTVRQLLSHAAVAAAAVAIAVTLTATSTPPSSSDSSGRPGANAGRRPGRAPSGESTPGPGPGMSGMPGAPGPGGFRPGGGAPGAGTGGFGPGAGTFGPGRPGPGGMPGTMGGPGFGTMRPGGLPSTTLPGGSGMPGGPGPGGPRPGPGGTTGAPLTGIGRPPGAPGPGTPGLRPGNSTPALPPPTITPGVIMETVLPVRKPAPGAAQPGQLPGTSEATQKALRDAAETARSQSARAAAQKLEEFAAKPENQGPEVYAFLGTLYLKLGDREKANQAFTDAARFLAPANPATPGEPGAPGTPGSGSAPGGRGGDG